jgi:cell division protein ZipA
MMSELRWALLIAGVLFIAALVWWERRRPRQARGALPRASAREAAAEREARLVREPPLTLPSVRAREPIASSEPPVLELPEEPRSVPVLGAAGVLDPAAVGEPAPLPGPPAESTAAGHGGEESAAAAEPEPSEPPIVAAAEVRAAAATPPGAVREILPELPAAPPPLVQWPADPQRRILAVRLVAPLRERFAGRSLRQALAAEGFVLGQFAIFHKPDEERRAVLSAASLTRPGTFDMQTMDSQHYGGLSLFAVLPGPKPPPQAFEELVFTARNLNERLHGVLQDERGSPLTMARIAQLREQVRAGTAS